MDHMKEHEKVGSDCSTLDFNMVNPIGVRCANDWKLCALNLSARRINSTKFQLTSFIIYAYNDILN